VAIGSFVHCEGGDDDEGVVPFGVLARDEGRVLDLGGMDDDGTCAPSVDDADIVVEGSILPR
jgi:hypothetical protein